MEPCVYRDIVLCNRARSEPRLTLAALYRDSSGSRRPARVGRNKMGALDQVGEATSAVYLAEARVYFKGVGTKCLGLHKKIK